MSGDPVQPEPPRLSQADADALDRLVERGWQADVSDERERAVMEAVRQLDALDAPESDPSLVDATLARVAAEERRRARAMRIDGGRVQTRRLADIAGVAAVLLLTVGVAWPMIGRMRATALEAGCANNLRALGGALVDYARDHRDRLPMAPGTAALLEPRPGAADWHTYDHMGNLVAMVQSGYGSDRHLQCPSCAEGRPHRHFAFRMPSHDRPFTLTVMASGPLLSDANPVIELRRAGARIGPGCVSRNHGQRGQNVLFGDGSVLWLGLPEVGGDHIFLPQGVSRPEALPTRVQLPAGSDILLAQ
jgi:hypothetical protein